MWTGKDTELHRGEDTAHENVFRCSYLESDRAECGKGTGLHGRDTAQNKYILGGGDTAHTFLIMEQLRGGGHRTYFVDEENNLGGDSAVGTPHNIESQSNCLN